MNISVAWYSDQGKRSANEDWISVSETNSTFLGILADGLGGASYGDIASRQAASVIARELDGLDPNPRMLMRAIHDANHSVHALQQDSRRMYTTASVLWLGRGRALTAHVGDTRIYHFRNGRILYRTIDHSVSQMNVMMGTLREDQIRTDANRNMLTQTLGDTQVGDTALYSETLLPGDAFLVCTDGFWEPVLERDMLRALAQSRDASAWLEQMRSIIYARSAPRQDNHTALCVRVNRL